MLFAEGLRIIPVRPANTPKEEPDKPGWEITLVKDGELFMRPSLLCVGANFHTAYEWQVKFVEVAEGESQFDTFFELNPELAGR